MKNQPNKPITNVCPFCEHPMTVKVMECCQCAVEINATFPATRLGQLSTEHQRFIELFVLASGSLKEIASQTGVSYPTVRARLDRIIEELRQRIDGSTAEQSDTPGEGNLVLTNLRLTRKGQS
jgi:hypothetical protein